MQRFREAGDKDIRQKKGRCSSLALPHNPLQICMEFPVILEPRPKVVGQAFLRKGLDFLTKRSDLLRGSNDAQMGAKSNAPRPLLPVRSDSSQEENSHFDELSHNALHTTVSNSWKGVSKMATIKTTLSDICLASSLIINISGCCFSHLREFA